ncbi:MAG: alkaline phosphatase family protein [Deltaproteobacteria bacterium]|nr:alkaline phosphatase family protein [Deltaproteobacteria bacterium]
MGASPAAKLVPSMSPCSPPEPPRRVGRTPSEQLDRFRPLALLALTAALIAALVVALIRVVLPAPPPPQVTPQPAGRAPLARHLALIVVDGLRYDVAADPERMPHFARAMQRRASAEIWAGPVTMTSSALLAYAAGVPGGLDEIVNNESARPTPYNNLIENARARGLVCAFAGDIAWRLFFPGAWQLQHPDPEGVGIEVKYDQEILDAAYSFLAHRPRPNLLVVHFVTPDHQAHVHGIRGAGYRVYLRDFDAKLAALLQAIPEDTAVFVTSDHGMTDTATHGFDLPEARRVPLYAYGPGIRAGLRVPERIPQQDLAATFAVLLGLPSPAHSHGHVLARLLDLPAEGQADVACGELGRLGRFAAAALGSSEPAQAAVGAACLGGTPEERLVRSEQASRRLAGLLAAADPEQSRAAWLVPCLAALGAALLAWLTFGRAGPGWREWLRIALVAAALLSVSLLLTRDAEHLPGRWPIAVRVVLTVAANTALAVAALALGRTARLLDRFAPLASVLVLGLLVVSYPAYTQAQSYILVCAAAALLLVPWLRRWLLVPGAPAASSSPGRALVALALLVLLWPLGFTRTDFVADWLVRDPALLRATVLGTGALFFADKLRRRPAESRPGRELGLVAAAAALAVAALWFRYRATSLVAVPLWAVSLPAGVWLWRSGRRTGAELVWLASYALVSREAELLFLFATLFVGEAIALGVAGVTGQPGGAAPRHAALVGLVALLFALGFVQRVGIQLGLDFPSIDWAAGHFGDRAVSWLRIGTAIAYKHVLALGALLFVCLLPLAPDWRRGAVRGLLLVELGRVVSLTALLFFCRRSFWTAMRVLSDLPHALIAVAVAAVAFAMVFWRGRIVGAPRAHAR